MTIIETLVFTRQIKRLLDDDEYYEFQNFLVVHPDVEDVIPGGGGLRKVRWKAKGRGKRGGLRIIYYWHVPDQILMLLPYDKKESKDLTQTQIKQLKIIVGEWLK